MSYLLNDDLCALHLGQCTVVLRIIFSSLPVHVNRNVTMALKNVNCSLWDNVTFLLSAQLFDFSAVCKMATSKVSLIVEFFTSYCFAFLLWLCMILFKASSCRLSVFVGMSFCGIVGFWLRGPVGSWFRGRVGSLIVIYLSLKFRIIRNC